MKNKRTVLLIIGGVVIFMCLGCLVLGLMINPSPSSEETPTARAVAQATEAVPPADVPEATETPSPTETPTDIPVPTNTPEPTSTPEPTETPRPTSTPTATREPIVITGSGDSVIDIDKGDEPALAHITGNSASRHFAVISYGVNGEQIDLLANTTDPFDGIRPIDFMPNEHTSRLEITATGEWSIEVYPLVGAHTLSVPGVFEGAGDDVLVLTGGTPDLAAITGNADGRHFAVLGYGNGQDLLVNTTDPYYEGTVILDRNTMVLEVNAEGAWSISVSGRD